MAVRDRRVWRPTMFMVGLLGAFLFAAIYDPRLLVFKWQDFSTLTPKPSASVEIANQWRPLKRRSMSVICSANEIRIALRRPTFWRYERPPPKPYSFIPRTLSVSVGRDGQWKYRWTLKLAGKVVEVGLFDTILSEPLTDEQRNSLLQMFGSDDWDHVSYLFGDVGGKMSNVTRRAELQAVLQKCLSN